MLEGQRSVQITVATVRYKSLGRPRIGVTSTYLAERLKVPPPCLAFLVSDIMPFAPHQKRSKAKAMAAYSWEGCSSWLISLLRGHCAYGV